MEVLPKVGFRQWTLSLPFALRWPVVKEPKLLRAVERCLARAIFRWQRRQAKRLGHAGKAQGGAVCFVQWFSGTLALQPHLHLLVPEGVWSGGAFLELPRPTQEAVEAVLTRLLAQARRTFAALHQPWPEDAFEALQLQGAQERLNLGEEPTFGGNPGRLLAVGEGFSLHAATHVHANDRDSLARLCRYGARGPIAQSRLSRRDDGRYSYATKKGVTLVLTAQQLVRRLLWLIPPAKFHLTSFHGVLSSHAASRAAVLPRPTLPAPATSGSSKPKPKRRPRLPTENRKPDKPIRVKRPRRTPRLGARRRQASGPRSAGTDPTAINARAPASAIPGHTWSRPSIRSSDRLLLGRLAYAARRK